MRYAAIALLLLPCLLVCACASPKPPAAPSQRIERPAVGAVPPEGAQVVYRSSFKDNTDGWSDATTEHLAFARNNVLKAGGPGKDVTVKTIDVPIANETVLAFRVWTSNCPLLFIQMNNPKLDDNFKSFWYLYPNRDYGRWVQVVLPLDGTLVDSTTNSTRTTRAGDVMSDIQIHFTKGSTIYLEEVVVYSLDAAGKLRQARAELEEIVAANNMFPAWFPIALHRQLRGEADELAKDQELTWEKAKTYYDHVADLRRLHERHDNYYAPAHKAFGKDLEFAIGTADPMTKLSDKHWMHPFKGQVTGSVSLESAGNEYESFQAVILPFTQDLKNVNVSFSDLKMVKSAGETARPGSSQSPATQSHTGGTPVARTAETAVPRANITWQTQPYVKLRPEYGYPGYDWVAPTPDPLLPGGPFDMKVTEFKPLWITVYTPPGQPAGSYSGTMTVTADGCKPKTLNIALKVCDFDIPLAGRFRCQTHLNLTNISDFYRKPMDQSLRRQWYEFLLKYRFCPTQQYSSTFTPSPEDIEFCKQRGNNVWILAGIAGATKKPLTPAEIQAEHAKAATQPSGKVVIVSSAKSSKIIPVDEIRRRYEVAKQHDILRYCHVYIGDETGDFELMQKTANVIHADFPGLKVMIGGSRPQPGLIGYIDIWDPIIDTNPLYGFSPKELDEAQKRGEEVMWYVAAAPQHPYPNVHMGDPIYASRMLFWLTWKYRITGFEYYLFNLWAENIKKLPRWPGNPWDTYSFSRTNGDGQLCYPGPAGPASSLRLENIRDGIEDWEVLYILEGAVEALRRQIDDGRVAMITRITPVLGAKRVDELLAKAEAAMALDDAFAKDVTHWAYDPAGLAGRRREANTLIEGIIRLIGKNVYNSCQDRRLAERQALQAERLQENRQRALKELAARPAAQ